MRRAKAHNVKLGAKWQRAKEELQSVFGLVDSRAYADG